MYPPPFAYVRPDTPEELLELVAGRDDVKLLAGGQSLVPLLKLRLLRPELVVDLRRMPWREVVFGEEGLRIGALVTHRRLEESDAVRRRVPMLAEAARAIGDLQVRTLGTVGGALAEADPAGDWCAAFLALDAAVEVESLGGRLRRPVRELFAGPYTPNLAPGEVLTAVVVPRQRLEGGRSAYVKLERRAGSFAVASAAAWLAVDGDGRVAQAGVALAGAGLTPFVAAEAEAALVGRPLTEAVVEEAAAAAARSCEPVGDLRGQPEYRRAVVRAVVRSALLRAAASGGTEGGRAYA